MRWVWLIAMFVIAATSVWARDAGYDELPRRLADMDEYDRRAMEPHKDTYDSMSVAEKARAYGMAFEIMHNRPPRFAPEVTAALARSKRADEARESSGATEPESAYAAMQRFYKKPPPDGPSQTTGKVLRGLPGPWGEAPAAPSYGDDEPDDPDAGAVMESLRPRKRSGSRARN